MPLGWIGFIKSEGSMSPRSRNSPIALIKPRGLIINLLLLADVPKHLGPS